MSLRVGLGVDAHAFADGVPLVLGGVRFESPRGLAGHSDGDVITHALIDAVLGAAGLGDIGSLFPSDASTPAGISCGSTSSNVCTHEFPDGTHLDLLVEQTTGPGGTMTCTFMLPDGTMTRVTAPCSYKVVLEDDLLVTIARRGATDD